MRLILILALAAWLRLYQLGSVPVGLYCDEAMDGNDAIEAAESGHLRVFYPENNGREGLYINLAVPLVALLGNTVAAIRLPAALIGILTVWLVYLLAGGLFSEPVALLAAFFMATSTWDMHVNRLTHRAGFGTCLLVLAACLVLAGARRVQRGQPFVKILLLAGAAYGLGFHTYTSFRVTPVLVSAVWLCALWRARSAKRLPAFWKASAAFVAAATLTIAPLAIYFVRHPDDFSKRASQVSALQNDRPVRTIANNVLATAGMFFYEGDPDWRHNISRQPQLFLPVAASFVAGAAIALLSVVRRRDPFPFALLLGWMAMAALPQVLSYDRVHAFRSAMMIPAVFILAAVGAHRFYCWMTRRLPRGIAIAVAAGFLLVLFLQPFHDYFEVWAVDSRTLGAFDAWELDAAAAIADAPRTIPKYVAIPKTPGDLVNGVPAFLQPVAYLTRSYTARDRLHANIRYLLQPATDTRDAWSFCTQVRSGNPGAQTFCLAYEPDATRPPLPLRP